MVPEKPSGILRVSGRVYEELGKPTTAQEWHAALLLPDAYEITRIEQIEQYFELHVLTWAIPVGQTVKNVYLTLHYTQDNEQGIVTLTAIGISYTAAIPEEAQKQKKIEVTQEKAKLP